MKKTLIKICGIKTPVLAKVCVKWGADFVGLVFHESSKRYMTLQEAVAICEVLKGERDIPKAFQDEARRKRNRAAEHTNKYVSSEMSLQQSRNLKGEGDIKPVGVFTEHNAAAILKICQATNINVVQLHGLKAKQALVNLPDSFKFIYVLKVDHDGRILLEANDLVNLKRLNPTKDFLLFDGINSGSGKSFKFEQFKPNFGLPFFLAGGLTPNNVKQAISLVKPDGVDVSSGVENIMGEKDETLIKQFIEEVKNVS